MKRMVKTKVETFDWSKPIHIEEEKDYLQPWGKKLQRDDVIAPNDGVAAKLALEIEKKKTGNHEK